MNASIWKTLHRSSTSQGQGRAKILGWLLIILFNHAAASPTGGITAVSSRIAADYSREKLPDGSLKSESYAFGNGGRYAGSTDDQSLDQMSFMKVAQQLVTPLSEQKFFPTKDAGEAKLLIMVYWGATTGSSEDPYMVGQSNQNTSQSPPLPGYLERIDFDNARLLGYDSENIIGTDYGRNLMLTALRQKVVDLNDEIRDNRYFVVLMAYDFQLLRKERKHKLLWETRFSLREKGNAFNEAVPMMAQFASRYFGRDSRGLIRTPLHERVDLGKLEILGVDVGTGNTSLDPEAVEELRKKGPEPGTTSSSADRIPARLVLPLKTRERIAAYQQEKNALQQSLADRLQQSSPTQDSRAIIDAFNRENSTRIAALSRTGENIRQDLATLPDTTASSTGQPLDDLRREFADDKKLLESNLNSSR